MHGGKKKEEGMCVVRKGRRETGRKGGGGREGKRKKDARKEGKKEGERRKTKAQKRINKDGKKVREGRGKRRKEGRREEGIVYGRSMAMAKTSQPVWFKAPIVQAFIFSQAHL